MRNYLNELSAHEGQIQLMYTKDYLLTAHEHSIHHIADLRKSKQCGCFYCERVFEFKDIKDFTDKRTTALCPNCTIDSVIGDASGYPVTDEKFLHAMRKHFFG